MSLDTQIKVSAIEVQIVSLLLRKDKQSIGLLYDHYAGALMGMIQRSIPEVTVAEEVLQDVLMKVWNNADKYDPEKGRLFTWLAQITRNTTIDTLRSGKYSRQKKTDSMEELVSVPEATTQPTTEDVGLKAVIDGLDEKYRVLIEAVYYKGYSQSEISEEMGIPLGTIKTRVRAALVELRRLLGDEPLIGLVAVLDIYL